jgi:excisionase family DNA binding protein
MTSVINEGYALTDPAKETLDGQRLVLSVAEAAELLGVSEWLVLQQIRLGTLPHKRCGRRIVLSRQRLMDWLNDT